MPTATSTVTATSEVLTGFNIAFDTQGQKWVTRYSYIPEGMERLKNRFFSFKDGSIYVHDKGTNNTFYGSASPSLIKIISNFNPSLVKTFDAISIEGNDTWSATFSNTDQNSSLATGDYAEKERSYYADIPRDTATSITANTTNITALGTNATGSTNTITFPNRINRQPIPLGLSARVYKVDSGGNASDAASAAAYASSVTSTTLTLQDATGGAINADIASGDTIIIQTTPKFDGDQLRDHYLVIELQNDNYSEDVELYAVNLKYKGSKLDDSLGNQAQIQ
tara:strand:- start:8399 stop:9241 length:843 start_codon:yes stop_codon:yes gene_type:complete